MPEAEREAIFERFERGSASARHAGSGLGLAIGRELARRMGGDLILADTGSGSGARFVLMLPPAGGAPGAPPRRAR